MMPSAFHRVKYNIEQARQIGGRRSALGFQKLPGAVRDQLADASSLAVSFAGSPLARTPEII